MGAFFNKKLVFDNISFMVKELGKKIGELESEAGVSPGYISRTSKDEKTKPGIDFILRVAEALGTSVDTLVSVDLAGITPTERYLVSFIDKLKSDTLQDKLEWERMSAGSLNRLEPDGNGHISHPLFSYETFYEDSPVGYPEEVSRVVFPSHTFDCHTYICGDCFSLCMKNGAVLHLMNISKSVHRVNDTDAYAKEVWMTKPTVGAQFLCSNQDASPLAKMVDNLYSIVKEESKHPKIKSDLQYVIDAFMQDDLSDDPSDDDLPF